MDLYGYCPRCGLDTSDLHDGTLCNTCEESARSGDELTRKENTMDTIIDGAMIALVVGMFFAGNYELGKTMHKVAKSGRAYESRIVQTLDSK